MKVLFIFLELGLSKKDITGKRDIQLLLWNQSQNESWKSFSFSLNWDFQKMWVKKTADFSCEFKAQMTCESHFHFCWIATFKKLHYSGQFDSCLETKCKWRPFPFVELWLSKNISMLNLSSLKVKSKWHFKVPSISLFCDFFC